MAVQTPTIRPQRTKGTPTEDGSFEIFESVPIFDMHEGDDGVVYDERLLTRIADNCNRRIRTTNDWAPVVVGHTRENSEKASVDDDPEVIGLAGPFYVGDFTNHEGQPSKAIYTNFWIFREDVGKFLKHPRRSVEIWPEENPESRFFDPISLLGAETPKRDLGTIYSRSRHGYKSQRYSLNGPLRYSKRSVGPLRYSEDGGAVSSTPGGNNTFLPGPVQKKKPIHNAKGSAMALSPDDLNQILEALKPTMQAMIDSSVAPVDDGGIPGLDAPGGEPPLDAPGVPPGLDAPGGAPPMAPSPAMNSTPDDGIPDFDSMDDEGKLYSRGLGRKFMKYAKDEAGADSFMGTLDDEDKSHLGSYMKYMCDDEDSKERYAAKYAKCPIGGEDITEKPGDSSPSDSMNASEMKAGEPQKYGKGTVMSQSPQQYAKIKSERDEAVTKYTKTARELEEVKQKYGKQEKELNELRIKERYARRFSKLKDLEADYAFDVEEELGLVEDFNDEQFDRHVNTVIPGRYAKVSGSLLPVAEERKLPAGDDNEKPQRYAKPAADLVQKYRKQGKNLDYGRALNHLIETDGNVDEDKLFAHNGNGHA